MLPLSWWVGAGAWPCEKILDEVLIEFNYLYERLDFSYILGVGQLWTLATLIGSISMTDASEGDCGRPQTMCLQMLLLWSPSFPLASRTWLCTHLPSFLSSFWGYATGNDPSFQCRPKVPWGGRTWIEVQTGLGCESYITPYNESPFPGVLLAMMSTTTNRDTSRMSLHGWDMTGPEHTYMQAQWLTQWDMDLLSHWHSGYPQRSSWGMKLCQVWLYIPTSLQVGYGWGFPKEP